MNHKLIRNYHDEINSDYSKICYSALHEILYK